jgi:serine phosphatase RsbU (regulator of sigma subunit)
MFSDGITEAVNAGDEEFGEERLLACARDNVALPPREMLDRIFRAVSEFLGAMPSDDLTATITRFR